MKKLPRCQSKTFQTQKKFIKIKNYTKGIPHGLIQCLNQKKKNLCPYDSNGEWILPEDVLDSDVDGWEKFKWARAEEIMDSQNYKVFEEGCSADDILQGSIGDCYFLSAIGSLCRFPKLIESIYL